MNLWRLTLVFGTLSLLGFGGGNAILPQMHADVVDRYHWMGSQEFSRDYALGKLSPGPTTTFAALIGFAVNGPLGAIVATLAVFVPAAVLVVFAGRAWDRLRGNAWRERAMRALHPVVLGLIWAGAVTVARGALDSPLTIAFAVVAALLLLRTEWNQSLIVLAAGAIGAVALR